MRLLCYSPYYSSVLTHIDCPKRLTILKSNHVLYHKKLIDQHTQHLIKLETCTHQTLQIVKQALYYCCIVRSTYVFVVSCSTPLVLLVLNLLYRWVSLSIMSCCACYASASCALCSICYMLAHIAKNNHVLMIFSLFTSIESNNYIHSLSGALRSTSASMYYILKWFAINLPYAIDCSCHICIHSVVEHYVTVPHLSPVFTNYLLQILYVDV